MTLPLLFLFSFVVSFGAVITPGPVSTAIVSESTRRGFIVGPLVATGHVLLELIMVVLIALGLSAGLNTPLVTTLIAVVGGLLLIWMGGGMTWGALRNRITLPKPGTDIRTLTNWQLMGLGVGATLANPFWYAWWVTVGASYVLIAQQLGWAGVLVLYLGHIMGDLLWDSILSGVVGGGRKWITNPVYKTIIIACGLYLIYLGLTFLTSAIFSNPLTL